MSSKKPTPAESVLHQVVDNQTHTYKFPQRKSIKSAVGQRPLLVQGTLT